MSTNVATKNNTDTISMSKIRFITQVGMLGAVAVILMAFEIPLPFAPAFYKIDFSEVPALIGCFAMGPTAGVFVELIKIVVHVLLSGTSTAGVGDVANFVIGCAFILPAAWIYKRKRSRKNAMIGMATGTVFMAFIGCFLNAYVLLPAYAKAFSMPIDALVGMGTAVNSHITNLFTFVIFAVAPFNILKGILVSVVVLLIYKKISPILKMR